MVVARRPVAYGALLTALSVAAVVCAPISDVAGAAKSSCHPRSLTHRVHPCPRIKRYTPRAVSPAIPVGRDGHVTKAAALEAFAATIGPLPGVKVRHSIYRHLPFATGPLEWVRYRRAQLSKAQRRAVDRAIAHLTGSSGLKATAAETQPERFARLLNQAKTLLGAHIKGVDGLTIAVAGVAPAVAGDWAFTDSKLFEKTGKVECDVYLRPIAVALADPELVGTLAHETFHCLANDVAGFSSTAPAWISEGLPEWVGCEIGEEAGATRCPPVEGWWAKYLLSPQLDVELRSYDAIGFYAHLAETGHDVYALAAKMLLNPTKAYKLAADDAFERSWASGYRRDPTLGSDWAMTGPGITTERYGPDTVSVSGADGGGVDLTVKQYSNLLVRLALASDVIVVRRVGGSPAGHLRDTDGGELGLDGGAYCTRTGGCACPGDPPDSAPPHISHDAWLALTGGSALAGASVRVTGFSHDNYCDITPKPKSGLPPVTGKSDLHISGDVTATVNALCSGSGRSYSFFDPAKGLNLRIELQDYHGEGDYPLRGVIDTVQLFLDGSYMWPAFDAEGFGPDAVDIVKGTWHVGPGGRAGSVDTALIYSSPSSTTTNPHEGQSAHLSGSWACGPD